MKNIYCHLVCVLLIFSLCQVSYAIEDRYALVIGNSKYEYAPLKNPANDVRLMSRTLQAVGFKVIELIDADIRTMDEAVVEFGRALTKGGAGLFYFAGHGIQYRGQNYLLPINTKIKKETDLKYEAYNANKIFDEMGYAENGLNIVILDACRDNPLIKSFRRVKQGLAETVDAPGGLLIAYSTSPGKQAADGLGENSPYTSHLVTAIKKDGIPLELVFKEVIRNVKAETNGQQIPWVSSSVDRDFYFTPSNAKSNRGLVLKPKNENITNSNNVDKTKIVQLEVLYWESVVNHPTKSKYQAYLNKYPDGHFREIAENELQQFSIPDEIKEKPKLSAVSSYDRKIKICANHLASYRLSSGNNGNALDCYKDILQQTPDDTAALMGLVKIQEAYIELISNSISAKNYDKAGIYLNRLESINPENKLIGTLKNKLQQSKSLKSKPSKQAISENINRDNSIPEEKRQIFEEYAEIVEEMLNENSLTDKQKVKVSKYLLKLERISSSSPTYLELQEKLYKKYPRENKTKQLSEDEQQIFLEFIEVVDEILDEPSINKKQIRKLDKYIAKLELMDPDSNELIRIKRKYKKKLSK